MALMRRTRNEADWPEWFPRRLIDLSDTWRDLLPEDPMRVEEFQEDGALVVRAEMPGIDPDADVEITVTDHTLCLKAERRQQTRTEDAKGFRSEFRYGSFVRTVALPIGATESDVKATYTDGILEVRIPIDTVQAAARRIPVARS
jgi:HSP20 family protein